MKMAGYMKRAASTLVNCAVLFVYIFAYGYAAIGGVSPGLFWLFLTKSILFHLTPFLAIGGLVLCILLKKGTLYQLIQRTHRYFFPNPPPRNLLLNALNSKQLMLRTFYQANKQSSASQAQKETLFLQYLTYKTDQEKTVFNYALTEKHIDSPGLFLYNRLGETKIGLGERLASPETKTKTQAALLGENRYLLFMLFDIIDDKNNNIDRVFTSVNWACLFDDLADVFGPALFNVKRDKEDITLFVQRKLINHPAFKEIVLNKITQYQKAATTLARKQPTDHTDSEEAKHASPYSI